MLQINIIDSINIPGIVIVKRIVKASLAMWSLDFPTVMVIRWSFPLPVVLQVMPKSNFDYLKVHYSLRL